MRKTLLAGGVALALLAFGSGAQAANTADNYTGSSSGSLLTTGNWSLNAVPTVANDAVFTATTGIRTLTAGNLTVGSFNVTTNGGTFGIRNATSTATDSILTLGGSGDLGNGVSGTAGDLLYVASGATFNIWGQNGSTGSGIVKVALGQSGNFNAVGTLNIWSPISGSGFGFTKTGAGTLTLTNVNNTYTGDTTISAGTLALAASGTIASSPNIIVEGSGTFDVSGLSSTLTLGAQTLKGPSTAATGTIKAGASIGLTLGATSSLTLPNFAPATPALTVSGGALTLNSATTVSVVIKNGGTPLGANDYKLISKGTGGSVAFTTTAPSVTVNGTGSDGIASGTTATLIITSGELYLHVSCTTPVGGTATATAATVCTGSGTTITLTGYTGTIQWYSSTDGSTYNIVSGETIATLSTGNLTQKTWYRATVSSGVCSSTNSSVATVDISPTSVGGTATATLTTVCTGSGTAITLTGYTGTIQWYSSTDGSTYNIVSGETSATLSTGNLTQKTWYRATVSSGVCSSTNSSAATVDVSPTSVGGTATATAATVCTGSGTTITLTDYTGTVQWYSSTDGSNYSIISGQTNTTLSTGSLTQKTYYRATVTSGACAPDNSSVATVDITSNVSITGDPSSAGVCQGSTAQFTVTANGVTGYQWQISTDNGSSWNSVSTGSGGTTYQYTTPAATTGMSGYQYRCHVTGCGSPVDSAAATLTVSPTSVGGTATATLTTVCSGSGTTITLTDYTGTIQWYSSTDGSTYGIMSGQTSATLSTGSLTQKTWYRATVTSGVCASADSSVATVGIYAANGAWTQVTNDAPWSERSGFGAVAFNGKIWMLGGDNGTNSFNDVWSSSDGVTWIQVTNTAPWSGRSGFGAVTLNGQMWVLGGSDGSSRFRDVWSSSDGVTWTQATSAAPWSARSDLGAVAFNGQMWVLGGDDPNNSFNDVWSSRDGVNWTQATSAAAWSKRWDFGAVAFNGQMWVLGGYDASSFFNDVWSSSNGVTWTQATNAAPWSVRRRHRAVALNGQMWVLGGDMYSRNLLPTGGFTNDVWSSSDGATWTQATSAAPWTTRSSFGAVALSGQMWVFGGWEWAGGRGNQSGTNLLVNFNDVWVSGNTVITSPDDIVTNISGCSATVTYPPATTANNCSGISTNYCSPASGSSFPAGVNVVTCTAQDTAGNTAASSFTITVLESTPPTISCPADITTDTDPPCGTTQVVTFAPTSSDNCAGVTTSCSPASGSTFPEGTNTVNCTATDASGQTASCSFKVIVNHRVPTPTMISCPGNLVTNITPNCVAAVTYAPTATPGCGVTVKSVRCIPASGLSFKTGITPVTCTAIDSQFHTNTCSFTVTVLNTASGALTYSVSPTNYTYQTCQPIAVTFRPAAKVSDVCLATDLRVIVTNYCVPPSKSIFPMGTTTVHCYAQDKSGNTATCSFDITLADLVKPTIKPGVKNECVVQGCDGLVSYTGPVSTDKCSVVTIDCTPASGTADFTIADARTTSNLVTCTATDAGANSASTNWWILVNQRVTPQWMAPVSGNGLCFIADTAAEPTNTFAMGQIVTNQVKLFDLNDDEVTAAMSNAAVTIQFSLRNQDTPTSSSLITNVTPLVPRLGRGTKGTNLKPVGTMKYITNGNYFAFDVITTNWVANTVSNFYRATVTVTPKPSCTKSTVGTGAVRLVGGEQQ